MKGSYPTKNYKLVHTGFQAGLIIKGIDGLLEIIGGFLLIYLNPDRLNKIIRFFTQHELSEDPKDYVSNFLLTVSSKFSINAQNFAIFYLITHGMIKCIIVIILWRGKLWAYPVSIASLILFILYQIYRYIIGPSYWLILLTLLDIIMIVLTILEYKRLKYAL